MSSSRLTQRLRLAISRQPGAESPGSLDARAHNRSHPHVTLNRFALALLTVLAACRPPEAPDPQLVGQWLRTSLAFVRSERLGPPVAARISAYGALALYEGYASDPRSNLRSMAGQLNGLQSPYLSETEQSVDGATVAAE